ncbi:hypothetical protein [Methylobacterium sp. GC_Met_2]|uniref:hypothetical protein n=1 Tax=Methylobacterium sp. GC_Met_2 TaxID=2937376 RepID=UPI00226B6854|nr:hypothetical protein [Methylobacterium sp. GC_Met_2]
MSGVVAAVLPALAAENAELRQPLAAAQDRLVETAIDAVHLHVGHALREVIERSLNG